MEQTALRPKPMPGSEQAAGGRPARSGGRPRVRRRRRLTTLLVGLAVATGLVLSGVGLGTVSATVIGMSKLADLRKAGAPAPGDGPQAGPQGAGPQGAAPQAGPAPERAPAPERSEAAEEAAARAEDKRPADTEPADAAQRQATLGVEAVDAPEGAGALLVGVHVPGPGHTAGLVRGDVLEAFGDERIASAADLARAVTESRPGRRVTLTVRHENGVRQPLSAIPGVMT